MIPLKLPEMQLNMNILHLVDWTECFGTEQNRPHSHTFLRGLPVKVKQAVD